jgi:RNA polymerase sigma factor (sigma-70 family)
VVQAEEREIVERALGELPVDYQLVIRRRHEEGLSFDAIGKCMGRSSGAAKQLWCRAIKALTRKLSARHER